MLEDKIKQIKEKIGQEPQIAKIVKSRYHEVRKWYKKSYFIILFLTLILIILNFDTLYDLIIRPDDVEINGILPLLLTVGIFILTVVPLLGIFTRKKCPHCHEVVSRDSEVCHKCGCKMRFYK